MMNLNQISLVLICSSIICAFDPSSYIGDAAYTYTASLKIESTNIFFGFDSGQPNSFNNTAASVRRDFELSTFPSMFVAHQSDDSTLKNLKDAYTNKNSQLTTRLLSTLCNDNSIPDSFREILGDIALHGGSETKNLAMHCIIKIGNEKAVVQVCDYLRQNQDQNTRLSAYQALRTSDIKKKNSVVKSLIAIFRSKSQYNISCEPCFTELINSSSGGCLAFKLLIFFGNDSVADLVDICSSNRDEVFIRSNALRALSEISGTDAHIKRIVLALSPDESIDFKTTLIVACYKMSLRNKTESVKYLSTFLIDSSDLVQVVSAGCMIKIDKSIRAPLEILNYHILSPDHLVARRAIIEVSALDEKGLYCLNNILQALKSDDDKIFNAAINCVSNFNIYDNRIIDALASLKTTKKGSDLERVISLLEKIKQLQK